MESSSMLTTPTFIIGLGGVGNAVVRLIRERFLSSEAGEIPPTVFLRSIDTADQSNQATNARDLPKEMYTQLGQFNSAEVVGNLDKFPLVNRWWKYPPGAFALGFINAGAGARRPVGRLCLFQKFTLVHDALQSDFRAATATTLQDILQAAGLPPAKKTARVYIIGSLAGGTCSGTFIDVAVIARQLLRSEGFQEGGVRVTGVFALPSVINLGAGDSHTLAARQRRVNTYAALRELDFLINRPGDQRIRIDYPDRMGRLEFGDAVYDQTYLFTDTKQGGDRFVREEDVLFRAAHFLYGQIALGTGEVTLQIMDNLSQYFDPTQRRIADGLAAVYGSFGVEWLEVPRSHLMQAWSKEIGEKVGAHVADFEWDRQPRVNLEGALFQQFPPGFIGYRKAIEFRTHGADGLGSSSDLPDLDSVFRPIGTAKKKPDLERALSRFEVDGPLVLAGVRRAVAALPTSADEEQWIDGVIRGLVDDSGFRIGGAKRVLQTAADLLGQITQQEATGEETVQQVVERCSKGFLSFGKVDPNYALTWAKRRLFRLGCQVVRNEIGDRAARLAYRCKQRADALAKAQTLIREEAARMGDGSEAGAAANLPKEMWLLDPTSIDAAIKANLDDVTRKVADRVSKALSPMLASAGFDDQVGGHEELRREFHQQLSEAIELAAADLTKRPADGIPRLKNRMSICQPMANVVTQGVDFLTVMREEQQTNPIKLVVTGVSGAQRDDILAWAKAEQAQAGDANAFTVVPSADPLRDDALTLAYGWPLCLFREVRECEQAFRTCEKDDPNQARFSFIMNEMSGIEHYDVMPRGRELAQSFFGVALALEHIKFAGRSEIVFGAEVFGAELRLTGAGDSLIQDAFDRFYRQGHAKTYESYLRRKKEDPRGIEDMRWAIRDALRVRREKLASALTSGQISEAMGDELERFYKLADDWSTQLVAL